MVEVFIVQNVKCGGCVAAIESRLQGLAGVHGVTAEVATGRVVVTGEELNRPLLQQELAAAGYPEVAE